MKGFVIFALKFYMKKISPAFPARCRYYPTCSRYALDAVELRDLFGGMYVAFLNEIIGVPLGYVVWFIYQIFQNYALAIIIFTILLRLVLIPTSIKQQKSTARMSAFQVYINDINKKYAKNPSKKMEELQKLYAEHNISPASGCLTMFIPVIVLAGMIDVVYRPLTHILHLGSDTIARAVEIFTSSTGSSASMSAQLNVINDFSLNPHKYEELGEGFADAVRTIDLNFLGFNLGDIANFSSITMIVPILSLILSFLSIFISMKINGTAENVPGMSSMKVIMFFMPVFSFIIALSVPMGVVLYWIIGYILQIAQVLVLSRFYNVQDLKEAAAKEFEQTRKNKRKSSKQKNSEVGGGVARSDKDRVAAAREHPRHIFRSPIYFQLESKILFFINWEVILNG